MKGPYSRYQVAQAEIGNTNQYIPLKAEWFEWDGSPQAAMTADLCLLGNNTNSLLTAINDNAVSLKSLASVLNSTVSTAALQISLNNMVATAANQNTGNSSLSSIDSKVSTAALQTSGNVSLAAIESKISTATKQDAGNSSLSSIDGKFSTLNSSVSTAAKQDAGNTSLSSIDTKFSTLNSTVALSSKQDTSNVSLASIDAKLTNLATIEGNQLTQLTAINNNTDQLEVQGFPLNMSRASQALSILNTWTVKNSAGTIYGVSTSNTIELRDNTTLVAYAQPGIYRLPNPIACSASVKVYGLAAANITLWYI